MKLPKSYLKILCVGCSHASTAFTKHPWPYWVAKELNAKYDILSSPGAGIQISVDKLSLKLSQTHYDLILFQTPHELRLSIGMNYDPRHDTSNERQPWETNGNKIGEHFVMGLNPSNNVYAMNKFFGEHNLKLHKNFNRWYNQYIADNTYEINVKFMQQIWTVQKLCEQHNTPYKIFHWHENTEISTNLYTSWKKFINQEHILKGNVVDYLNENKMAKMGAVASEYSTDKYHLNDIGSQKVANDFILRQIDL